MAGKNKNKANEPIVATGDEAPPAGKVWRTIKGVKQAVAAPVADDRQPQVIFADRVEATRLIMRRQMDKLVAVGNARNATPTSAQEEAFRNWLAEESDRVLDALFGKLHAEQRRGSLLTSADITPGYRPRK